MTLPHAIYTDGGVCGRNPSKLGGSWAFVWVSRGGELLRRESGFVEPADLGLAKISNNDSELIAVVRALESVPMSWQGFLYSDSLITLHRLRSSDPAKLPACLRKRVLRLRRVPCHKQLVGGHPNAKALELGWDDRGLPVSKWNVHCDALCCEVIRKFRGG